MTFSSRSAVLNCKIVSICHLTNGSVCFADLANLSTASPDSPPAEEEAAPPKQASTAKSRPAAGKKAVEPPAVASDAAPLTTRSARPAATSEAAAKEEATQPPAATVQPEREDSPVPAPGLRDPARCRKAIKVIFDSSSSPSNSLVWSSSSRAYLSVPRTRSQAAEGCTISNSLQRQLITISVPAQDFVNISVCDCYSCTASKCRSLIVYRIWEHR